MYFSIVVYMYFLKEFQVITNEVYIFRSNSDSIRMCKRVAIKS